MGPLEEKIFFYADGNLLYLQDAEDSLLAAVIIHLGTILVSELIGLNLFYFLCIPQILPQLQLLPLRGVEIHQDLLYTPQSPPSDSPADSEMCCVENSINLAGKMKIIKDPLLLLLGTCDTIDTTHDKKRFVFFTAYYARYTILLYKKSNPPTLQMWKTMVSLTLPLYKLYIFEA